MPYRAKILSAVLGPALAFLGPWGARAQESAAASAGEISETLRAVTYPEIIYPHGFVPDWDRGYLLHHEIEESFSPDAAMVTMWDATGKRVRDGRIWPQGATRVRIRRAAATRDGAILAAGGATLQDGSRSTFIAKTDLAGNTIQTINTDSFSTEQLCEAGDGSVWALGREIRDGKAQHDADVLRQYGFEKGLLRSYLPQRSVEAVRRSEVPWFTPFASILRCGKDKISVYLDFTDEYAEVDTSSFELKRWKLDVSAVDNGKASGLGITGDGRVFASFSEQGLSGPTGLTGLFEVKAEPASGVARLLPVKGTVSALKSNRRDPSTEGIFYRLWGAEGNELAVERSNQDGVLWVTVVRRESAD